MTQIDDTKDAEIKRLEEIIRDLETQLHDLQADYAEVTDDKSSESAYLKELSII